MDKPPKIGPYALSTDMAHGDKCYQFECSSVSLRASWKDALPCICKFYCLHSKDLVVNSPALEMVTTFCSDVHYFGSERHIAT